MPSPRSVSRTLLLLLLGGIAGYLLHRPAASADVPVGDTSIARGAQLVTLGGCDDCHTPALPSGEPDMSRRFSGQPEGAALPPAVPGVITWTNLAFRGPWGLSLARNITPDLDHGIGNWTLDQFVSAMRTGKNPSGRVIQPPMPAAALGRLPDADLAAIYNYLRTVKPSANAVTGP